MGQMHKETFVCVDCESTGLDPHNDRIIEVAAVRFTMKDILGEYQSLVDPGVIIPEESIAIHNITQDMVTGSPRVAEVLPDLVDFMGDHIIIGHGIMYDLQLITSEAQRHGVNCPDLTKRAFFDTLRMARLYGDSPTNSLRQLGTHFNLATEGAHRAMNDVVMNVGVFRYLAERYRSTDELFKILKKPIRMKIMPLGKHKGRRIKDEVPIEYLRWMANKDFDDDLLFSVRSEIKRRAKGGNFSQSHNPFHEL